MTSGVVGQLNAALSGRYQIERELGAGGMATVYLADDVRHRRKVALKVLRPELAAVVGAERFLAEIEVTANLQHPHILPLFDSGEADGYLFLAPSWRPRCATGDPESPWDVAPTSPPQSRTWVPQPTSRATMCRVRTDDCSPFVRC
jgi:serine/threonine protein kinase